MSYDKMKLATHLKAIIENTTDDLNSTDQAKPHLILSGAGSRVEFTTQDGRRLVGETPDEGLPTLCILEGGVRSQQAFVNECLKERDFATQIGGGALEVRLHELVREFYPRMLDEIDFVEVVKKEVLQFLRAEIRSWCVRVPISNLRLNSPLIIGNVTFVRHEDGCHEPNP